jgi:transposase
VWVADAQKVKGLAPPACKTDKIDAPVLAVLSQHDLAPAIWLPDPSIRCERELARFRLHLVRHRTRLKNRVRPRRWDRRADADDGRLGQRPITVSSRSRLRCRSRWSIDALLRGRVA